MSRFVVRSEQLGLLSTLLKRVQDGVGTEAPGKCVLMRGRRRVGKSRLAEVFVEASGVPTLYFTASRQGIRELDFFAQEVAASDLPGASLFSGVRLDSWDSALRLLGQALPDGEPSVVVIDEFPYLVEQDSEVEATFQKQWDRSLSRKPVLLILIGSDLAMMEALNTHDRAFYQRGTEMVVPALSPSEAASIVGAPTAADAFDAYLLTGGLPLICDEWPAGVSIWDYLEQALSSPTSALIVSAERVLAAEFPSEALALDVLSQIGAGETTFTNIARAAGGLQATSLKRALDLLTTKRVVARELPLSTKPSKEARYRVADPYLRFWLAFVGPHMAEIERGRSDRVLRRIRDGWTSWRGRAIEPVVREALRRLLPFKGLAGEAVGGFWTRTNTPEVDLVGADRAPLVSRITFTGTIKWRETEPLDGSDLNALAHSTAQVPGAGHDTPLVAVSRSGVTARASVALGPEDLMEAWASEPSPAGRALSRM
jgi:AAA+ ATPase superfamily predicted ATPase